MLNVLWCSMSLTLSTVAHHPHPLTLLAVQMPGLSRGVASDDRLVVGSLQASGGGFKS